MCNCNPVILMVFVFALPFLASALLWLSPFSEGKSLQRRYYFYQGVQMLALLLTLGAVLSYLGNSAINQAPAVLSFPLVADLGISFSMYLSPLNVWFLILSAIVFTCLAFLSEPFGISSRVYFSALLFLQAAIVGVLTANDLLFFYVSWELMLLPIFILMGLWGGAQRNAAVFKFVIFTVAGSLLMFAGIAFLAWKNYAVGGASMSFAWESLRSLCLKLPAEEQLLLFSLFMAAFLVKVPAFPLHGWIADTYEQASYGLNLVLAGLVGKLGVYGIIKFVMPFFPLVFLDFTPWLALLALVGILYGAVLAFAERDLKRILAYSSFSHVSYCLLALVSGNSFLKGSSKIGSDLIPGVALANFQIFSHGLIIVGLFVLVFLLERIAGGRRALEDFGGVATACPSLAVYFMLFMLASIGLPLTSGFVAEFLILLGLAERFSLLVFFAVLGVILSAVYMLTIYMKVFFGEKRGTSEYAVLTLKNEVGSVLIFTLALIFILGVAPRIFFDSFLRFFA
jgi:NADH-quinone oxidoreductase subunit M